jgi:hypothetical protein
MDPELLGVRDAVLSSPLSMASRTCVACLSELFGGRRGGRTPWTLGV